MHGDHFDAPALRAIADRRKIEIVVPAEAVSTANSEVPSAAIRGIAPGEIIRIGDMTIRAVPVIHGDYPEDAYRGGAYLGYFIDAPGYASLFHGGDLIPSTEMLAAVKRYRPRIMALPINGRDWYRERQGFVGCMSAEEAAITAIECEADVVIPLHYDAVKGNGADPADLVRHVRAREGAVSVLVPPRNKSILVGVPA
jgi:L-ascorbate metabolism protein UlaG (beta-lactamase superfamily)